MQITIAGGCGDFGRSCFLLKEGDTLLSWMRELRRTDWTGYLISQRSRRQEQNTFHHPFAPGSYGGDRIFRVSRLCGIRASDEPDIPADERKTGEHDDS